ncbi:hypothetical protein [Caenispirillum bisanense]|uniref:hypothetical protein n=1 Tax=Caenispirillum bisanense TaxID=414052 RepID=UPI0031D7AFF6
MDSCLSIYFPNFGGQNNYAYDLRALGHFYRQYQRLMAHSAAAAAAMQFWGWCTKTWWPTTRRKAAA